jgi:hypothetical protein
LLRDTRVSRSGSNRRRLTQTPASERSPASDQPHRRS